VPIFEEDLIQPSTIVDSTGTNTASVSATGALTVIQPTGANLHVDVDNFPGVQPVSGTVTVVQPTGTNLHTVVDNVVNVKYADVFNSGVIAAVNAYIVVATSGCSSAGFSLLGSWTGTLVFEGTIDQVNWFPLLAESVATNVLSYTTTTTGLYTVNCGGFQYVRVRASALAGGAVNVACEASIGVYDSKCLQLGIWNVGVNNFPATQAVTGTFWQTTQPVSGTVAATESGIWTVQPGNTANTVPWLTNLNDCNLSVTGTAATGAALTITLPAVALMQHHITSLEIMAYSTAARTGGVTPILVTSTNLPGSNVWTFATASAVGSTDSKVFSYPNPYRSTTAGIATTIVCPAATGVIWRVNVVYYAG
jgi:hypothetical protein